MHRIECVKQSVNKAVFQNQDGTILMSVKTKTLIMTDRVKTTWFRGSNHDVNPRIIYELKGKAMNFYHQGLPGEKPAKTIDYRACVSRRERYH